MTSRFPRDACLLELSLYLFEQNQRQLLFAFQSTDGWLLMGLGEGGVGRSTEWDCHYTFEDGSLLCHPLVNAFTEAQSPLGRGLQELKHGLLSPLPVCISTIL